MRHFKIKAKIPPSPAIGDMYMDINTNTVRIYTGQGWQEVTTVNPIMIHMLEFKGIWGETMVVKMFANHTMMMWDKKTEAVLTEEPDVIIDSMKEYLSADEWLKHEKYIIECIG